MPIATAEDWAKQNKMKILITGGAGFIGSHLVRLMVNKYPNYTVHNLKTKQNGLFINTR